MTYLPRTFVPYPVFVLLFHFWHHVDRAFLLRELIASSHSLALKQSQIALNFQSSLAGHYKHVVYLPLLRYGSRLLATNPHSPMSLHKHFWSHSEWFPTQTIEGISPRNHELDHLRLTCHRCQRSQRFGIANGEESCCRGYNSCN